jgi:hypothetical protein
MVVFTYADETKIFLDRLVAVIEAEGRGNPCPVLI